MNGLEYSIPKWSHRRNQSASSKGMTPGDEFQWLIRECAEYAYSEPPTEVHTELSDDMCEWFLKATGLNPPAMVLDIGAGSGCGLDAFYKRGFEKEFLRGTNINETDIRTVREKGYYSLPYDLHYRCSLWTGRMGAIWMRHILEHSPCPLLVLKNAHRMLRVDGYIYVEVPAPDTPAKHQENPSHFTCLTQSGWAELIKRAGFTIVDSGHIELALTVGNDTYFMFAAKK